MSDSYGNLPLGINNIVPEAKQNAEKIVALVKHSGKVTGYKLSNGEILSKSDAISYAKAGNIKDVGVATRKGNEYLRALPDGSEDNNLGNLPSVTLEQI